MRRFSSPDRNRLELDRSLGPEVLPPAAMRDSIDYADARTLLASISGTREEIWTRVEPLLDPSQPDWKRQNFDALWRELHGSP